MTEEAKKLPGNRYSPKNASEMASFIEKFDDYYGCDVFFIDSDAAVNIKIEENGARAKMIDVDAGLENLRMFRSLLDAISEYTVHGKTLARHCSDGNAVVWPVWDCA